VNTLPARHAGFTLLEVLVALAIVTVGMAALLSTLSMSADSVSYLRDKMFAEWVALNRIEEVRLGLQRPQTGKTDGEAELADRKWRWEQEVLETEVKGILRIDVRVRPTDAPGPKDSTWYTTLSGITGDALSTPKGDIDVFGEPPPQQDGPGGDDQPRNPRNPRNPQQPGPPPDDDAGAPETPPTGLGPTD